jgi:hypothetical protein
MNAHDEFETEDGAAALLLCAKCKRAVKTGEEHQCNQKEIQIEKTNKKKFEWSSGTGYPL